jgi:hypothetical protein
MFNKNALERFPDCQEYVGHAEEQINLGINLVTYDDTERDAETLYIISCFVKKFLRNNATLLYTILGEPISKPLDIEHNGLQFRIMPFDSRKPLSDSSVEGVTWLVGFTGRPQTFVLKYSVSDAFNPRRTYNMLHEIVVGKYLNLLRKFTPNFMYTYGGFICSTPKRNPGVPPKRYSHDYTELCSVIDPIKMDFISLTEIVKNPMTFDIFYRVEWPVGNVTDRDVADVIKQILYSIWIAQYHRRYVHGDLHSGNVLITTLPAPVTLQYSIPRPSFDPNRASGDYKTTITTKYLVKIIDYGFSIVKTSAGTLLPINNEGPVATSEFVGNEFVTQNGIFFPLFDACRILNRVNFERLKTAGLVDLTKYKDVIQRITTTGRNFSDFSDISERIDVMYNLSQRNLGTLEKAEDLFGKNILGESESLSYLILCFN